MLRKGDLILGVVVVVLIIISFAAVSFYRGTGNDNLKVAIIMQNDKVIERIVLDRVTQPYEINVSEQYDEVILVENGRIRFKEAGCPDKVCVKSGWLSKKGDMSVCLPNKTMIKIEGQRQDVDIVTN